MTPFLQNTLSFLSIRMCQHSSQETSDLHLDFQIRKSFSGFPVCIPDNKCPGNPIFFPVLVFSLVIYIILCWSCTASKVHGYVKYIPNFHTYWAYSGHYIAALQTTLLVKTYYSYISGAPELVPQVPRPWDQCWKQNL